MEHEYKKADNNWKLFIIVPAIFMFILFSVNIVFSQRMELDSNGKEFQIFGYNDDNKIGEPKPIEKGEGDFKMLLSMPSMYYGNATLNNVFIIAGDDNLTNENISCTYNLSNAEKVIVNYYNNNVSTTWVNLPFENNKTNMLKDFSGNDRNLYNISRYNFSKNGGYDNYGSFEGFYGNDGLKINSTLNVTEFTISVWVKPKSFPSVCDDDKPYNFQSTNGVNIAFEYADWDCDTNNIYYAFDIGWGSYGEVDVMYNELNVYNKFDFVWKKGEYIKVYMNGILNGTDDTDIYNSTLVFNSTSMFIGCRYPDCAKEYNGFIDDFKIFTRVLSDEEILLEYNLDNKLLNNTYTPGIYQCSVTAFTNDTISNTVFSSNNLEIFSLSSPIIISPVTKTYNSSLLINYTEAVSYYEYSVTYNISLLDSSGSYLYDIIGNNGINLTYLWNTTLVAEDNYKIKVIARDSLNQSNEAISDIFTIDNTNIYHIFYIGESPITQLENSVIKFYVYTDLIDTTLVNIVGLHDGNYLFNITNASNNYNLTFTNGTYGVYCFKSTFYNSHNKNISNTKCFSLVQSSDFTTINSLSQSDSVMAFVIFICFLGLVLIGLYFSNPAFAIMGYMAGIWFGIFMLRMNYLFGVVFIVSCLLAMLTSAFK